MGVDGVTIGTQYPAFGNFRQDSLDTVSSTLDHIGQVNQFARARAIFCSGVQVVKL
jgi:hypothetical protein